MSDSRLLLHARAAGRAFLLPLSELREVVPGAPVAPIPSGPPGIQGVVLHHGEFLPVLDWGVVGGDPDHAAPPTVLAVLRPRLGLPLEGVAGTVEAPEGGLNDSPAEDAWRPILAGLCQLEDQELPVLDADRLLALLHRLRKAR
ncbi:chemotaxis protein CheW [Geothrix sp. SG200]|uniref:chemotaxis protein CheW n=1 Tax=Geothrix sp. SG200 TaxID=2922865 RepID=UPI001FAC293C|nr:chemotaxis protein CheW [Geothrix sp. SG200]